MWSLVMMGILILIGQLQACLALLESGCDIPEEPNNGIVEVAKLACEGWKSCIDVWGEHQRRYLKCLDKYRCDKEGDDGVQKVTLNCEGCAEDRWEHRQIFFTCLVKSVCWGVPSQGQWKQKFQYARLSCEDSYSMSCASDSSSGDNQGADCNGLVSCQTNGAWSPSIKCLPPDEEASSIAPTTSSADMTSDSSSTYTTNATKMASTDTPTTSERPSTPLADTTIGSSSPATNKPMMPIVATSSSTGTSTGVTSFSVDSKRTFSSGAVTRGFSSKDPRSTASMSGTNVAETSTATISTAAEVVTTRINLVTSNHTSGTKTITSSSTLDQSVTFEGDMTEEENSSYTPSVSVSTMVASVATDAPETGLKSSLKRTKEFSVTPPLSRTPEASSISAEASPSTTPVLKFTEMLINATSAVTKWSLVSNIIDTDQPQPTTAIATVFFENIQDGTGSSADNTVTDPQTTTTNITTEKVSSSTSSPPARPGGAMIDYTKTESRISESTIPTTTSDMKEATAIQAAYTDIHHKQISDQIFYLTSSTNERMNTAAKTSYRSIAHTVSSPTAPIRFYSDKAILNRTTPKQRFEGKVATPTPKAEHVTTSPPSERRHRISNDESKASTKPQQVQPDQLAIHGNSKSTDDNIGHIALVAGIAVAAGIVVLVPLFIFAFKSLCGTASVAPNSGLFENSVDVYSVADNKRATKLTTHV